MVDAVIFALRDNGFLVYVPQYGLKGPVYLESRDKEVREIPSPLIYRKWRKSCLTKSGAGFLLL